MSNTNHQLDQLSALEERLKFKKTRLGQKLEEVERQLEAVKTTRALLNRGDEKETEDTQPLVPIRELQGMTQVQALVHIAKRNHNRIRIVDVRPLLARAGVMKVTKNSYNILYTVIKRSERFKPMGRGEYELLEGDRSVVLMRKRGVM